MPGQVKYTLKKPVESGSEMVTILTFRDEICAGDMRGIPIGERQTFDDYLKIAARLCGQPDAIISKLGFADTMEVIKLVSGFTDAGSATGNTA